METATTVSKLEIWHKDYNLRKRDNLNEIPAERAVFGIFGIVDDEPINCRYIGETEDLRATIKDLFENPNSVGMKKFMQGAWIQMLQYEIITNSSASERQQVVEAWISKYKPNIDEEGDYPGYYNA